MRSLLVMVSLSLVRKEARYHCKGTLSRRNVCRNWTRGVSLEVSHNYGQRMHFVSLIYCYHNFVSAIHLRCPLVHTSYEIL